MKYKWLDYKAHTTYTLYSTKQEYIFKEKLDVYISSFLYITITKII